MLECMIIGDSIAVGTSYYRKECETHAKSGWNSQRWNQDYLNKAKQKETKTLIISLGANDYKGIKTEEELRKMRTSIKAERVFWISPGAVRKPVATDAIMKIAKEYGDTVIGRPESHMSGDGVHPTGAGYKILANLTK